jgi:hypothetical protein
VKQRLAIEQRMALVIYDGAEEGVAGTPLGGHRFFSEGRGETASRSLATRSQTRPAGPRALVRFASVYDPIEYPNVRFIVSVAVASSGDWVIDERAVRRAWRDARPRTTTCSR